jgi:hypothetical protein
VKIDGRSLPHSSLETIRRLAWKRVQAGEKPSEVVKSFGFSRTAIYRLEPREVSWNRQATSVQE